MEKNKIRKVLFSFYGLQILQVFFSILRIPIIIKVCGVNFLGQYVVLISLWQFVTILGDTERNVQRISIKRIQVSIFQLRKQYLFLHILVMFLSILYISIFQKDTNLLVIFIFLFLSLLSIKTAESVGAWEAAGNLLSVNILSIVGQIISTFCLIASLSFRNVLLTFLITIVGNIFPGLYIMTKFRKTRDLTIAAIAPHSTQETLWNRFFILQLVERTSFVLDPLIITNRLGFQAAAAFAIYQKILIMFSITPTALSALAMRSRLSSKQSDTHTDILKITYLSGGILTLTFLIFGKGILELLTHNSIEISQKGIVLVTITGLVGTLASPTILSTVSGKLLTARIRITSLCTILSLIVTWLLCPLIGLFGSFLTSLLSSALVFGVLKLRREDK
jgi:hypothetical protein